ncbi:MAG: mannose-1-phosphate guanylyltransferase [Moorellales bacterium]
MPVVAVVMAGGRGERFWPLSRETRPKQFLRLVGKQSLLQATVARLDGLVRAEDTFVVTGRRYAEQVGRELPQVPRHNILVEPQGRDTAPCIGLATVFLRRFRPEEDPVMLVLPADHLIADLGAFIRTLKVATEVARREEVLVCIGIEPTRPETGYGYIECGPEWPGSAEVPVFRVKRFREKPDRATAEFFLRQGGFFWNSGMFAWRRSVIERAIATYLPELAEGLEELRARLEDGRPWEDLFGQLPRISVDYGVMEKADNVAVVKGSFGWDDVGTWSALSRVLTHDGQGNVVAGAYGSRPEGGAKPILLHSRGCVVYNGHRLLAAVGVEDLIIVDTEDALLICKKQEEQRLKELLGQLRQEGLESYL